LAAYGPAELLPEPIFALWSRRPTLASAGAGVVTLGGDLSDISEGEEEPPSGSISAADHPNRAHGYPAIGGEQACAEGDIDVSGTLSCSPRRDAAAEPSRRCGSPGSNNAVPWRQSASRAGAASSRRKRAA